MGYVRPIFNHFDYSDTIGSYFQLRPCHDLGAKVLHYGFAEIQSRVYHTWNVSGSGGTGSALLK